MLLALLTARARSSRLVMDWTSTVLGVSKRGCLLLDEKRQAGSSKTPDPVHDNDHSWTHSKNDFLNCANINSSNTHGLLNTTTNNQNRSSQVPFTDQPRGLTAAPCPNTYEYMSTLVECADTRFWRRQMGLTEEGSERRCKEVEYRRAFENSRRKGTAHLPSKREAGGVERS